MEFEVANIAANITEAWLEDTYTLTRTAVSLSKTTTVTFAIKAEAGSKATDRFRLVFRGKGIPVETVVTKQEMLVYPNPATTAVQIQFSHPIAGRVELQITDAAGTIVSKRIVMADGKNIKLSTAQLASGTYIIKVIAGIGQWQQKLVVVK